MARPLHERPGTVQLAEATKHPWAVALVLTVVVLLLLGILHGDTAAGIAHTWTRSETYTHGWLILPIAAWLIWRSRADVAQIEPRVCWWGLLLLAGIELVWVAASIADVVFARQFAVMALIPATALVLLGPRVVWRLAFPLAYLVFAVPWGASFIPTLQDITAWMSVHLLELSAIPVFWEGRLISIPVGDFEVAEACSGVRYVIASLALGALYAYLAYRSPWRRLAFLLAALLVPIVANGIRAYGIIMIAHWSNMRLATGVDHVLYGWVFFGIVMFLLFWIGSLWREPDAALPDEGVSVAPERANSSRWPVRAGASLVVVAVGLVASSLPGWTAQVQPLRETTVSLPSAQAGWQQAPSERPDWTVGFAGADDVAHALYRDTDTGTSVQMLVIHYRNESQGSELINSRNQLYGDPWQWLGEDRRTIEVGGAPLDVRRLRITRGARRQVIWSWYDIGGWQTSRAPVAKSVAALKRLSASSGDATLVALATGYDTRPAEADERLEAFLAAHPQVWRPRGLLVEQ